MNIEDIQENCRIGQEVSVIINTGHQFSGILSEIKETSIVLRQSSGGKIPLLTEAIITIFEVDTNKVSNEVVSVVENSLEKSPLPLIAPQPTSSNPETLTPTTSYSIEVITQVVEIAASFKIGIEQTNLEPLPTDFSVPIQITSLGFGKKKNALLGEWNKVKSRYDHAVKNKDLNRFNQIIDEFKLSIHKYPELSLAGRFNIGCLYLELNKINEAIKAFEINATELNKPEIFYNLAIAALHKKDLAKAGYAFKEFFKQSSIQDHLSAWYKLLGIALESGAIDILIELLNQTLEEERLEDAELIIKSVVFILKVNKHDDQANQLMTFLLETRDSLKVEQVSNLIESILSKVNIEPSKIYLNQQQNLQEEQKNIKRQEEAKKKQKQIERYLNFAQQYERQEKYSQAIPEVRKALQVDPENIKAKKVLEEYLEAHREKSLPRGSNLYDRARRADLQKNYQEAEKLYLQAIKEGDNLEGAIKNLASLYQQLNEDDKGVNLLLKYQNKISDKKTFNNLLAETYKRRGNYLEEIACREEVLALTPYEKRPTILKVIASAYVRIGEYNKAIETLERVLRQTPSDENASKQLEGLREAENTGIYTKLDALFLAQENIAEAQNNLSNFMAFHVEKCDYAGVEASKIANKELLTEKDSYKLGELADDQKSVGTKRPRERANYYLSAAKILIDLGYQAEDRRTRQYLRNFCAAMGDACIAENTDKDFDVARSYYTEAFLIAPEWIDQLELKLVQYIMLYYPKPEAILKAKLGIETIESCLDQALKIVTIQPQVIEGLWYLSWINREVGRVLINKIHPNKRLRELVQNLCYKILGQQGEANADEEKFLELWNQGQEFIHKRNQDIIQEFVSLDLAASKLDLIEDQIKRVNKLEQKVRGTLDKRRLNSIKDILTSMYDYTQQQSYTERERLANIISNRVKEFDKEIEQNPTKYSCELFRTYVLSLGKTIEQHFDQVQQAAEPEELLTELSIDSYIPDSESKVLCQITISNETGKSPASAIKIQVQDSPTGEYKLLQKRIDVTESLQGGQSVTLQIPVIIAEIARNSQVFNLYYQLSFTTRRKSEPICKDDIQSIRLYPETNFQEINNPYATYAQGITVKEEEMFFGRKQFIDQLLSDIRNAASAKSVVIYGQKRAGKSSILYHLKRQLEFPIIAVSFSIGDIIEDFSVATFLYRIIQCIEEAFEELADEGYSSISVERPTLDELQKNPQLRFQDYMLNLKKTLKKINHYKDARIMLLIDEFSYIYGEIIQKRIQDTFMKFWKALLEKCYFGVVLVGQDTMPQFIKSFPNEFQVAENRRVSYLVPDDARDLIVQPILIPETKESRYKGSAVSRLIELTAGSPYYIQMFCKRLVDYMNRTKTIYVTDADIEQVKDDLISGHNSLEDVVFDNLISAGDKNIDNISSEDALAVLRDIANGTRIQTHCNRSVIKASINGSIDEILDDLVRREVIEKYQNSLFRIRVGLFKQWLLER
jgi:tetratricopeptide (TPR) repeat protein